MKEVEIMVTYYIQKQLLSANVRTTIKDNAGKPEFLLVGRWGLKGDSLSVYDMAGEALATVKQNNFAFSSQFDFFVHHQKVGTMNRLFPILKDIYYIRWLKWLVVGDSLEGVYEVYHIHQKKMSITTIGNLYKIEIMDQEDIPLCLCLASVLDYWANHYVSKKTIDERKNLNFEFS